MTKQESAPEEFALRRRDDRTEPERRSGLSGILSLIFRSRNRSDSPGQREDARPALSVLESIAGELQTLTDRAETTLKESASRVTAGVPSSSSARRQSPDRRSLLREEREVARRAMEQDIVRLHRQMETGITPERMERLARVLVAHSPASEDCPETRFQDRIEMEVLRYLYLRAGEAAWSRLQDLLARSGLAWPPPDGLSSKTPTEELQRQREAHNEQIRKDFMVTPAAHAALLIHGSVGAWRYGYPARNSYLWLQTILRAIAAALRAEAFAAAAEVWLWRSSDLEREILDCVSEKLGDARNILERGCLTATDGERVVAQVDEVCGSSIPRIVWSHAAERLRRGGWRSWPEEASAPSTDEARIDPVCGMTLPAHGVAEQFERGGRVFYFCNATCRRKFEGQQRAERGGSKGGLS
jgi:YHS domain-containing protein